MVGSNLRSISKINTTGELVAKGEYAGELSRRKAGNPR
jgi:hypothetical protein